jgi:hypothetical protein
MWGRREWGAGARFGCRGATAETEVSASAPLPARFAAPAGFTPGPMYSLQLSHQNDVPYIDAMSETAKTLRDRIALLRTLLSESVDTDVARNYLNKIVMAEAGLRELASRNKKKP